MDYCIVEHVLFDCFSSFRVNNPNTLTDYCLIEFYFKGVVETANQGGGTEDCEFVKKGGGL